jgi:hypothetical protein
MSTRNARRLCGVISVLGLSGLGNHWCPFDVRVWGEFDGGFAEASSTRLVVQGEQKIPEFAATLVQRVL